LTVYATETRIIDDIIKHHIKLVEILFSSYYASVC